VPTVYVPSPFPAREVERLRTAGHDVRERRDGTPPRNADAWICLLSDRVDASIMDGIPGLRILANVAVGYENIDVDAAMQRDVIVTNTPDVLTESTADLTFGLILGVLRHVVEADRAVRSGIFPVWGLDQPLIGADAYGRTLGIFGLGRIGTAVARRGHLGFRMPVIYVNQGRNVAAEEQLGAEHVSFEELLVCSDVLCIHAPLTDETRHRFGRDAFARMKPSAVLINVARGPLVDEAALVDALRNGEIAGAGLDVFEDEPVVHPGLLEMTDRVVLTPHIGSATRETRDAMAALAVDNVLAVLGGQPPLTLVRRS